MESSDNMRLEGRRRSESLVSVRLKQHRRRKLMLRKILRRVRKARLMGLTSATRRHSELVLARLGRLPSQLSKTTGEEQQQSDLN